TNRPPSVAALFSRPQFPATMPTNTRWPTSRSEGTGSLLPDLVLVRPLATGGQVDAYTLTSQLAGAAPVLLWIVARGCGLSRVPFPDLCEGSRDALDRIAAALPGARCRRSARHPGGTAA